MKVLVREPIAEAGVQLLRERFEVDVDPDGDLAAQIGEYDAIIIRSGTHLTAELIDKAANLKVIGRAGVGIDNVDLEAASRRGIVVANAPESTIVSAGEHTLGLLLALSRSIPQAHAALKEGRWERSRFAGHELAGKTLGLVGFGRIGRQVARLARGLDMRVLAFDPYVGAERFEELGVARVESLAELLAESDFASLHLTLTEDTQGLIGREELAVAKDGIKLVNAARGELVDEDALVEALRSGKVGGAALDVFAAEPYSGPLLELDNVVVTPHLAGSTAEAQDRAGVVIAEQVAAALDGEVVRTAVNIPVVDARELEVLGPFVPLAAKLGRLAVALAAGWPSRVTVAVHGPLSEHDTRLLTVAALNGIFQGRIDETVNDVNAPAIAAERGIEVAEQVAAALEGRVVTNAVNVPAVAADEVGFLGPFLPLAAKLGALAVELTNGTPTRLDFAYLGELAEHDTRLLTVAALNGAFQGRVEQAVNYVNAPLLAAERGIEVTEERRRASRDFTSLVRVTAVSGEHEVVVAGTPRGREAEPRLVRALGYEIEIDLAPYMLFAVNDDRPGRIGRLGTLLGEARVNIANMAVSRRSQSAKGALMALTLDSVPAAEVLQRVETEPGFTDVRFIDLSKA